MPKRYFQLDVFTVSTIKDTQYKKPRADTGTKWSLSSNPLRL